MRKAIESQGNIRTLPESFSTKTKGKDLAIQQHIQRSFSSSHQKTPMKPSQVPNWHFQPPSRRSLPLQSPELCHRDRQGAPCPLSHTLGQLQSSGFVLSSQTNTDRSHHIPSDRPGHLQHSAPPQFVPVIPTKIDTSATKLHRSPQRIYQNQDFSNHSPYSHLRRVHAIESKDAVSDSGSKTVRTKSPEKNKVQSSDAKSSIPTVQLHRFPVIPSQNSQAVQQHHARPLDPEKWSPGTSQWPIRGYELPPATQASKTSSDISLPVMHSAVAPGQDQQHKPSKSQIPVVDWNCSSQKRRRDLEESDDVAKKQCVQGPNSGKAQTAKSTVLDPTPRTTDSHLCTEPFDQSTLELSSTFKPTNSSCTPVSPKTCLKIRSPMGAKQVLLNSCENHVVKLRPHSNSSECNLKKKGEENKKIQSSTLFPEALRKHSSSSPHVLLGRQQTGHIHCSNPVTSVKTLSRNKQVEERRKSDSCTHKQSSKPNSASLSCCKLRHNKTAQTRRHKIIPDDADELFTPDPKTYVVGPTHRTVKPVLDGGTIKSPTDSSSCPVTGSSCHKTQNSTVHGSSHSMDTKVSLSARNPQLSLPTVDLVRIKPTVKKDLYSKDGDLKNSPVASSDKQLKEKTFKSDEKRYNRVSLHTSGTGKKKSPSLDRRASEGGKQQMNEEDPIDVELGLSFALDMDLTQSSHSSEEEQLLSLQEMMERVTKPPDTPVKGTFSEPSTPGQRSCQLKVQPLLSITNSGIYKNNLDQMLKEINTNKKAKEIETELLTACNEDLLRIAEYEEAEENQEEGISSEQQEFLQRYSLMSNAIKEVPPGEVVFNLEKFGQIFNQGTLQLRQCMVNPQGTAQKTLLWSSPAQLRLHLTIGLFQEAYGCSSPCPTQVTRFLFKMMSVHSEGMMSDMMLQALCDIACTAACQKVKNGKQQFKVWVPSLADVTLVLMNMGVSFVTLFPFERLQPSFTEGDLLEDEQVKIESPCINKGPSTVPEHNCNNILKYLSYCTGICPRAYSDNELLLLLTVLGRIGLDTRLILNSSVELYPLQYQIVNNIRNWDNMLPRICQTLADMTDDHHNMCLLVQTLPDNTRGRQLRRHLSLSMISKLLDGNCTYRPTDNEFQLSNLRPYLRRMQPSTILRTMLNTSRKSEREKEEDMATLDQQAYYLCYSLLTLANEALNFQFFPAQQKKHLLFLCSELETHVKCDIRESEKCLYRSKVKDLVARIYTKWQMLLQRTRPLHGKLYDYWQPLPLDTLISSQEEQAIESGNDGEATGMQEDPEMDEDEQEEDTNGSETNEVAMIDEDEEQKEEGSLEGQDDVKCNEKLKTGDSLVEEPSETEYASDMVPEELNQAILAMESEVLKESETDVGNTEHVEMETEKMADTMFVTCHQNQVAECDSVS